MLEVSDVVEEADEPGVGVPADCRTKVTGYACDGCWTFVAPFAKRRCTAVLKDCRNIIDCNSIINGTIVTITFIPHWYSGDRRCVSLKRSVSGVNCRTSWDRDPTDSIYRPRIQLLPDNEQHMHGYKLRLRRHTSSEGSHANRIPTASSGRHLHRLPSMGPSPVSSGWCCWIRSRESLPWAE